MSRRFLPILGCAALAVACTPKPSGPITTAFDGVYRGSGYNASPPDWGCPAVMPADPLTVSGGAVSYDQFSGWVPPDGSIALSSQEGTLSGQFGNGHFEGTQQFKIRLSPRPGCAYTLKLDRGS